MMEKPQFRWCFFGTPLNTISVISMTCERRGEKREEGGEKEGWREEEEEREAWKKEKTIGLHRYRVGWKITDTFFCYCYIVWHLLHVTGCHLYQGAKPPVQVANITWRFNNRVINTDSSKYTQSVTPNGNLVRLTIRSLTLVDTGQYQAFVSHEARPEDITINLSVKCKCNTYRWIRLYDT